MVKLKNEYLEVSVKLLGAELTSIVSSQLEILWDGGEYWRKQSPLLFPFIGTLNKGKYSYKDNEYEMKSHGFISTMNFNVDSLKSTKVVLSCSDNEETLKIYPFKFKFTICYELISTSIVITTHIENLNEFDMYYNLGFHPGFAYNAIDKYKVSFEGVNPKEVFYNPVNIYDVKSVILKDLNNIELSKEILEKGTVCFKDISLIKLTSDKVDLTFTGDFDSVALWQSHPENPKFLCIEPWIGLPDYANDIIDITKKENLNSLSSNNKVIYKWKLDITRKGH
ncbi:MAG: hypothetical protein R3Y05_00005 [bacterium]